MDIIDYQPPNTGYLMYRVGTSTSTQLVHPAKGTIPTAPTYIYILHQIDQRNYPLQNGGGIPYDAVYAREYTKGLVLYRTLAQYSGLWNGYENGNPVTVPLPGTYRKVNYDGTLGPPVTEIEIRGFEGIILVKAAETSVPNIQLTMSVDKPNPKPMDVVTVTLTATNMGTGETSDVEVRIPLGNMTYEQGSLSPSDCTADTSERDVLKIRVPRLAPGGTKELRFRAVVR